MFVRAGSIIPRQAIVQSTTETPQGPLELNIYPGANCKGALYSDDGHSMAYQKGGYLRQSFGCTIEDKRVMVSFGAREGQYIPSWTQIALHVFGWSGANARVKLNGHDVPAHYDATQQMLEIIVPDQSKASQLIIQAQ